MASGVIASGSSVSVTLAASDVVVLECDSPAQARIYAVSGVQGSAGRQVIAEHAGGRATYGPFGAGVVSIAAYVGEVSYTSGAQDQTTAGTSSVQNVTLANTPNLRAMRAAGKRGRIVLAGDSFLQGFSSGGSGLSASVPNGPARKLAARLNAAGAPARADWFQGWPSSDTKALQPALVTAANLALIDPRLTITACDIFDTFYGLGGWPIQFGTAGADRVTFKPGGVFDTIQLVYARSPGQGTFLVSIDGGSTTLQTVNDFFASNDIATSVISCPAGSTAVTISKGSASSYICLVGTRQSSVPDIEIINGSITGTTLQQYATAPTLDIFNNFNFQKALPILLDSNASNLVVLNGWFNDYVANRTIAQVQADLNTVIDFCQAQSNTDVMFVDYTSVSTATIPQATGDAYRAAVRAVCIAQGIPYLNLGAVLTSYSTSVAQGLMGDTAHLNNLGHTFTAALIEGAIMQPITA